VESAGVPARILGGVAVAFHAHEPLPASLVRTYADIDLVVGSGRETDLSRTLTAEGYEADRRFNALYGHKRQLFWDRTNDRQLDVFVGQFSMCHALPLDRRLADPSGTLTATDLLLTKLQIVELNPKDVIDALALVLEHATGRDADGDVLALDRLTEITANDWGWFTTVMDNLGQLKAGIDQAGSDAAVVRQRIAEIRDVLEAAPKSLRWRARARIGRRMPWYELPEEHVR
jgi:hypothetical protein